MSTPANPAENSDSGVVATQSEVLVQPVPGTGPGIQVGVTQPMSARTWWLVAITLVALAAMVAVLLLWQRLSAVQEQLARQIADTAVQTIEARTMARQAIEVAQEAAAKLAVSESRLNEVSLQRSQLESLMQSLSRSRDENLVVDIESAVRLAQQQAQLTGSVEPLLAALKSADQRVTRAAQPRLNALQRAVARDMERVKATALSDTPAILVKLDDLVRMADDIPLVNSVGKPVDGTPGVDLVANAAADGTSAWWKRALQTLVQEGRGLLRVSRIEQPESALLSPEQSFFVRENFKLKVLNARLGLLARQLESARTDLRAATASLNKYFDPGSRKTQSAAALLKQVQAEMRSLEVPNLDDTLAALATAAAGR